jgi:hypothetical protein
MKLSDHIQNLHLMLTWQGLHTCQVIEGHFGRENNLVAEGWVSIWLCKTDNRLASYKILLRIIGKLASSTSKSLSIENGDYWQAIINVDTRRNQHPILIEKFDAF